MSVEVMGAVFRARLGGATAKVVALKLADHAHEDGSHIFPAVASVARATEISEATVRRVIRRFVECGLLFLVEEGGHGRGNPNHYAFAMEVLEQLGRRDGPTLADLATDVPDGDGEPGVDPVAGDGRVAPAGDGKGGHGDHLFRRPKVVTGDDKVVTGDAKGGQAVTTKPSGTITNHQCSRAGAPAAATPRDRLDAMEAGLRAALGPAGNDAAPGLCNLAPVLGWLDAGADLERDVLPAIRAKARTLAPASVRSWQFFAGPVADWRAARARGLAPAGGAPPPDPATFTAADWAGRLAWVDANGVAWPAEWGERAEAEAMVARAAQAGRGRG
jgi:hypothetical protein